MQLRVWQASVGRLKLYLLDSNDPLNTPVDRGITGKLYGGGTEIRFMQEIVLGIGGWRVVEALHPEIEICHINEGHAAFAVLERACLQAKRHGLSLREGLWAARPGNVFTTHTPMPAGFDRFEPELVTRYLPVAQPFLAQDGAKMSDILALGRADAQDAQRAVQHGVSGRARFGAELRRQPSARRASAGASSSRCFRAGRSTKCPIGHVTNGVHIPSWDSAQADRVWTEACGKERWRQMPDELHGTDHLRLG